MVLRILVLCLAALCAVPAAARAEDGDVIVRFRAAADAGDRADARTDAEVRREGALPLAGLELVDPQPGVSAKEAVADLEADPDVLYAEPDVPRRALALPNDRFFRLQWGLDNTGQLVNGSRGTPDADIDAPEAWELSTGDPSVLVAVVDSGVDPLHPDLAPNLVAGYDFYAGDADPSDENGHGTHVAGTIGARGNDGFGITGVAWQTRLLPLRTLGPDGKGSVSDAIRAYGYARSAGAKVINLSLGGGSPSRAERDAINAAKGALFVAAAGNDAADNDTTADFPCNYDLANVVCVAASDRDDALAGFSNYGVRTVDLAAPGVSIASTHLEQDFAYLDGTSMATPHVSGVAALLFSREPAATVAGVRRALLLGADPVPALAGVTATGARLNASKALAEIAGVPAPPEGSGRTGEAAEEPVPDAPPVAPEPAPAAPTPTEPTPTPFALPALPAPRDLSAPLLALRLTSVRRVATLLSRGQRLRIRCSERCALRVDLRKGSRVLVGRTATQSAAGWTTVTLRPATATARRSVRRGRTARLTIRVVATDPAGNRRTVSRSLSLRAG